MNRADTKTTSSVNRPVVLAAGDFLAMVLIVWIGRISHAFSLSDLIGSLVVAAPFLISWFLVTPWFGLFRADVSLHWRKLAPRLLLSWWIIGIPLSMVLRALFLGRPIPEGIVPVFALVMLATTTLAMLLWRLAYIWLSRQPNRRTGVTGLGS